MIWLPGTREKGVDIRFDCAFTFILRFVIVPFYFFFPKKGKKRKEKKNNVNYKPQKGSVPYTPFINGLPLFIISSDSRPFINLIAEDHVITTGTGVFGNYLCRPPRRLFGP